jgi:hypothetical protein
MEFKGGSEMERGRKMIGVSLVGYSLRIFTTVIDERFVL